MKYKYISSYIIRGGTSKGLFFNEKDLPSNQKLRDHFFLKAMGSPDPYSEQMDGLGGGSSSTSKVVIINKSKNPSYDIQYLFGQVEIKKANVDYSGSCGNMVAAVGHFALAQTLINRQKKLGNQMIDISVLQKNINKKIILSLQCDQNLNPILKGNFHIFGIPGTYPPVKINFIQPGDGHDSNIFPTGNKIDLINLQGKFFRKKIEASLVNVGNPTIFVRAKDIGLVGTQNTIQNKEIIELLQNIRCVSAVKMGIGSNVQEVRTKFQTFPKISFVSEKKTYQTSQKTIIQENQISLIARIMSLGKMHHTFTVTGLLSLATSSAVPGSIPNQFLKNNQNNKFNVNIGHRGGKTSIKGKIIESNGKWKVLSNQLYSSARILMRGQIPFQES